ncbi:hypothetical protein [Mesorhizobium xinjiangense]|uniref:hypothetical protein n=1 Tax=Mesorhizobium xinjiangense TaxID=2678685 RepID=UPI0012EE32F6|nr:hypothetical protein [Mesorhizobium xinjiangense]
MKQAATLIRLLTAVIAMSPACAGLAQAEEPAPALAMELNGLEKSQAGCRLTFVVTNDLGKPLDKAAFEIVLFDQKGLVDRLSVLDFKALPAGKTKVRQFDLPGVDCPAVSRVLVDDATACQGDDVAANACIANLKTETKSPVAFGS